MTSSLCTIPPPSARFAGFAVVLLAAACSRPSNESVAPARPSAAPIASDAAPNPLLTSVHPEHEPVSGLRVQPLLREAIALEDAGDFRGAIAKQRQLLAVDPSDVRSMNVIAGLYGKLGESGDIGAHRAVAGRVVFLG